MKLSLWRLGALLVISLMAGFVSHIAVRQGWLGTSLLRSDSRSIHSSSGKTSLVYKVVLKLTRSSYKQVRSLIHSAGEKMGNWMNPAPPVAQVQCCTGQTLTLNIPAKSANTETCGCTGISRRRKIFDETWKASSLIIRFMLLAFFLNALIRLYIPQQMLMAGLSGSEWYRVVVAGLVGIPTYTTNLLALPLMGQLLEMGMNPGAALAFLLTGPVTTIPAMVAVWGIANRRVFILYILISVVGALITGMVFNLVSG
jgi:uncharacterized protein